MPRTFLVLGFFMCYKLVFILLISFGTKLNCQSYIIKGKVIQTENKYVLIGCSVYNITQQTGTITNEDGEYQIKAEKGDQIQFTYIGMLPLERFIIDDSELNVELQFMVRRIREVKIRNTSQAKESVLYNPNYEKIKNRKIPEKHIEDYKLAMNFPSLIFTPWNFLYYSNKRVQRRLTALQDMRDMDNSEKKYSLDFISIVTGVEDMVELKDIRAHCYFPHELVLRSSYYDIGIMLKECYIGYLEEKKAIITPPILDSTLITPVLDTLPKLDSIPAKESIPKD